MMANWLLALVVILALGISNVVSANFQSAISLSIDSDYSGGAARLFVPFLYGFLSGLLGDFT